MTMNVNSLLSLCHQNYASFDINGFRYKVALYLSYLHIKFDDEIELKGIPWNFKHTFRFACVKS